MRRQEKQVTDRADIQNIINSSVYCVLSIADGGQPYAVPVNFAYDGNQVFIHSAMAGTKIDILSRNQRVCLVFTPDASVKAGKNACSFGMTYRSAIIHGRATFLDAPSEKASALNKIAEFYGAEAMSYPETALNKTAVFAVDIDGISAKAG